MKPALLLFLLVAASTLAAQNRKTVLFDSLGQQTTREGHWAQVIVGRHKSVYLKPENKRILTPATQVEYKAAVLKTEQKITRRKHLGTDFPDFDVQNLNGNRLAKSDLKGKVLVLNFWFIGCAPCEMERPALNDLTKMYADNKDVVFIAFAKNDKEALVKFLQDYPIHYNVVPTDKDYIKKTFSINAFPVNIVVGKDGKYVYNSAASGIGIRTILQRQIEKALKG